MSRVMMIAAVALALPLPLAAQAVSSSPPPIPREMIGWLVAQSPQTRFAQRRSKLQFAPPASQSYLGLHIVEISDERARELNLADPHGVEIMSVAQGSPAEEAGLHKGDVVLRFRGQRVEGGEQFVRLVRETPPGRNVTIAVLRDGKQQDLELAVGERKQAATSIFNCGDHPCEIRIPNINVRALEFDLPKPLMVTQNRSLGAEIESLDGQLAEYFGVEAGLLVRSVGSDSAAERAGLRAGDVVVEVAGRAVKQGGDLRSALLAAPQGEQVNLTVVRNKSRVTLRLESPRSNSGAVRRTRRPVRGGQRF